MLFEILEIARRAGLEVVAQAERVPDLVHHHFLDRLADEFLGHLAPRIDEPRAAMTAAIRPICRCTPGPIMQHCAAGLGLHPGQVRRQAGRLLGMLGVLGLERPLDTRS